MALYTEGQQYDVDIMYYINQSLVKQLCRIISYLFMPLDNYRDSTYDGIIKYADKLSTHLINEYIDNISNIVTATLKENIKNINKLFKLFGNFILLIRIKKTITKFSKL